FRGRAPSARRRGAWARPRAPWPQRGSAGRNAANRRPHRSRAGRRRGPQPRDGGRDRADPRGSAGRRGGRPQDRPRSVPPSAPPEGCGRELARKRCAKKSGVGRPRPVAEVELPDPHGLAEKRDQAFSRRVALLTAVYAVVLAIAGLGGKYAMKEMLLAQQQSSDQWAFYQAKVVREHLNRANKILVETQLAEPTGVRGAERTKLETLAKRF